MEPGRALRNWGSYCIHLVALPLFFICFMLLFDPEVGNCSFRELYAERYTMDLLLLSAILLGSEALMRLIYTAIFRHTSITWFAYVCWCALEVVVTAQFFALYTCPMVKLPYLQGFLTCLRYSSTVLVFPYAIIALSEQIHDLDKMKTREAGEDQGLLRFHDENQKLKLVIAPSAVLFLQSDENYVKINYLEGGKVKTYVLRKSMKSLEQIAADHGLRRCHRSYIVNPSHIHVLRKNPDGVILADFDIDGVASVPVSKRYYNALSDLL